MSGRHLVLVGEMGVGKTTLGRLLADSLGRPFLDSDEVLEDELGMTGSDFARLRGVPALHGEELRLFLEMVRTEPPAVIASAASIIEEPSARQAMAGCIVVWVEASLEVARQRMKEHGHRRRADAVELRRLKEARRSLYESVADIEVSTDVGSPDETADRIVSAIEGLVDRA